MTVPIAYMGTKRLLAPIVSQIAKDAKPGPILDVFSGMCAVGGAVAATRQVWNNDIQVFASMVAKAVFSSHDLPHPLTVTADIHYPHFEKNFAALKVRFKRQVDEENQLIESGNWKHLRENFLENNKYHSQAVIVGERNQLREKTNDFPYRLFSLTYGNTYLGWLQCLEVDSIVYAIHSCHKEEKTSGDQKIWLLIALGQAILRVSTTTGHFAQFLSPNKENCKRFCRQRQRSIWEEWIDAISELEPLNDFNWRKQNRIFNEDSLSLLVRLKSERKKPSVIYADPPYTDDQYSRYYHLLETLVLYDYPMTTGFARYRKARFQTPFSLKRQVKEAFEKLISSASALKSELILSYPTNGLLYETGTSPLTILRAHYQKVEIRHRRKQKHSTFGASKGAVTTAVTEVIYRAIP